jgi:predicted SnoaL-like aldol condensation-catalyzing enzyme
MAGRCAHSLSWRPRCGWSADRGDCLMTRALVVGVFLLVTVIAAAGAAVALGPTEKRAIVRDLLKTPETRDRAPIRFVNDANYIQHNANVEDGKTGLMSLVARLPKDTKIETVRLLADGDYLNGISQSRQLNSRETWHAGMSHFHRSDRANGSSECRPPSRQSSQSACLKADTPLN